MRKLVFISYGLSTAVGKELLGGFFESVVADYEKAGEHGGLSDKTILLVLYPEFVADNDMIFNACIEAGFAPDNIYLGEKVRRDVAYDFVYVTEGNTFEVLDFMCQNDLGSLIRENVPNMEAYIGCSAGAMIAGKDIRFALDFDKNYPHLTDYTALGIFDGAVIPHYNRKELERFLANSDREVVEGYREIINVRNDEMVILSYADYTCSKTISYKCKRIRSVANDENR